MTYFWQYNRKQIRKEHHRDSWFVNFNNKSFPTLSVRIYYNEMGPGDWLMFNDIDFKHYIIKNKKKRS